MHLTIPDDEAEVIQHLLAAGIANVQATLAQRGADMRNPALPPQLRDAVVNQFDQLSKWLTDALGVVDSLPDQLRPQ